MAKSDGRTAPLPVGKLLPVDFWAVVGVHDEAIHTDPQKMIHCVGDNRTSSNFQEGLRALLCERPKPRSETCSQDEGCSEPSSFLCALCAFAVSLIFLHFLFFPNSGSIFTRPVTMNPGIVAAITQRKKFWYPNCSWSQPLAMAGTIIPRAMIPVEMA